MTPADELNLQHQVDKIDDDLTALQKRVAALEKALETQSANLKRIEDGFEAELKRHWVAIMATVRAFKTLPGWVNLELVEARQRTPTLEYKKFQEELDNIKAPFNP